MRMLIIVAGLLVGLILSSCGGAASLGGDSDGDDIGAPNMGPPLENPGNIMLLNRVGEGFVIKDGKVYTTIGDYQSPNTGRFEVTLEYNQAVFIPRQILLNLIAENGAGEVLVDTSMTFPDGWNGFANSVPWIWSEEDVAIVFEMGSGYGVGTVRPLSEVLPEYQGQIVVPLNDP